MEIGTQIGPYRIDALLGKGGMAEVYKVTHTNLHRSEAMKVLPPAMTHDHSFVERFLHEARTAANLHHPNIAVIHSVSDAGAPQPYFTMELVEGGDLADWLAVRGPLPLPEALPIVRQVAEALDYAHSRGLIHRDVKPGNVLLKSEGAHPGAHPVVKVVDFGIARAQEEQGGTRLTKTGMIVGTPEYMSPEQAGSGARVDHRTDIYALGVIAYEMLCGQPPFRAEKDTSMFSVIMQHVRDEPRPPIEHIPTLSKAANAAILKALAKNPEDRFASCGEFVRGLAGEIAVTAVPPRRAPAGASGGMAPGASHAPRKSPWLGLAVGALAFVGAGLIGYALKPKEEVIEVVPTPDRTSEVSTPIPTSAPPVTLALVPNVVGMSVEQAHSSLQGKTLGLEVKAQRKPSPYPQGRVASQSPEAGKEVPKGAPVYVALSSGPLPTPTPVPTAIPQILDDGSEHRAILSTLEGWKASWEQQDAASHMSYYTSDAQIYSNRKWWRYTPYYEDRLKKYALGGEVRVSIDTNPVIVVRGDTADVSFRMTYSREGGSKPVRPYDGRETIKLRREGGVWKIYYDKFTKG